MIHNLHPNHKGANPCIVWSTRPTKITQKKNATRFGSSDTRIKQGQWTRREGKLPHDILTVGVLSHAGWLYLCRPIFVHFGNAERRRCSGAGHRVYEWPALFFYFSTFMSHCTHECAITSWLVSEVRFHYPWLWLVTWVSQFVSCSLSQDLLQNDRSNLARQTRLLFSLHLGWERERGMVMLNYSCMCSEWWHTLYHLLFIEKANYHA